MFKNKDINLVKKKVKQIPHGYVSTYKLISQSCFNSSNYARYVGYILKKCSCKQNLSLNCKIGCFRVIKSNYSLGKFILNNLNLSEIKKDKLSQEKIFFDHNNKLLKGLRKVKLFNKFT
jgi:alkylated DNA nucleotide flippase Atl1